MNIFYRLLCITFLCFVTTTKSFGQFGNGTYYIYNVNSDAYLGGTGYNGAGATLIKHGHPFIFTVYSDSLYTIDSHFYSDESNHYLDKNIKLDSEPQLWQFIETTDGNYAITYDGRHFLASENASTSITTTSTISNRRAQWKIIKEEDRINAFKANDDATFLIHNADFNNNYGPDYNESYWVINSADNKMEINLASGNTSNTCAAANHTTFDISQIVEGIPCGTYSLQAQAFYRLDGTRASYIPEIYIDDEYDTFHVGTQNENSDKDASASFSLNLYDIKGLKATTYNGKIVVGARLERGTKLRSYWDNFVLTYENDLDLEGYKKAYEESIKETERTLDMKMNKDIRDSLISVLAKKDSVEQTKESIKPFVNALNKARKEANKSAKIYKELITAYENCTGLDEFGQKIFYNLTAGIIANYEEGLIENGKKEIMQIDSIYLVTLKSQITEGTDMTGAIVNPDINGSTGWTCEKPYGGNGPLLNNVSFEYWAGSSISIENRSFNYYQKITGLQNGKYTVTCKAFNSKSATDTDFTPACGLYAHNGQDTVKVLIDVEGGNYNEYTTPEIEAIDNTLTIGVTNFSTMLARWFSADSFRLTLVSPDPELGIDDTDNDDTSIEGIYSINGIKRKKMEKGLNIVRYTNGKIIKKYK